MNSHRHTHKALDENERRKWQNPEATLAEIGMGSGLTFMDIGCGEGFFAIPAARIAGESGKVYGLDNSSEAIRVLREKAIKEGLSNLDLRVGKAEDTILCAVCADIVFFGGVFHDFADPIAVLTNARKMLKPAGLLIDLDWKKETLEFGPPLHVRFSEEHAKHLIEEGGFVINTVNNSGPYHYMITARL